MIDTVYVESSVQDHPRTIEILGRLSRARVVPIDRYGEVFNSRRQSFRLQKRDPALILARREGELLQRVPEGFGLGPGPAWYWSHLLNCPYDCSYCFLQGMFRSANYVLFVDYEAFGAEIERKVVAWRGCEEPKDPAWFFSGYDCDSLALDGLTGFAQPTLDLFERLPDAWLELRTKSVQVRALEEREPLRNVVVAFSLAPSEVADRQERRAPSIERRLEAAARLAERGWWIGIRFDPVVRFRGAGPAYSRLLDQVAAALPADRVHSVTVGSLRLPTDYHRTMSRMLPHDPLIASLQRVEVAPPTNEETAGERGGGAPTVLFGYPDEARAALLGPIAERCRSLWGEERLFSAGESL